MAEGQVLIKDLPEATAVEDSSFIPVDNGSLTQKITVENFNNSSNQTAKGYAEQAQAAATTATEAIADVNSKVDAAQAQANIAATQAGYAQTYAGNAQTYAGNAQGYANTAQGSATNAAASASAASSSADAANDNATMARSWAEGNTGAREGENTNNARYWANKAESAARITIDPTLDPSSTNPVENRAIYEAINSKPTGGSNITITTTETSLRGKDCVLTDGTTSYTKKFDLTRKALFEGVQMTGDLTISATDGTQTATGSINVPYFGNYSKRIAFWSATIDVTTTTTQFNGLTVSAKKNGVVMGSGTFNTDYGKNLLKNTATSQTINGVTFTVNADKSVTVNGTGTNSNASVMELNQHFTLPAGNYILSGSPHNVYSDTGFRLRIYNWTDSIDVVTCATDENVPFTIGENKDIAVRIWYRATPSTGGEDVTFYPMIRRADITDPTYEPYHDPITSASITVPEAGTYTLEVTLDWKTYTSSPFSVSEETTYEITLEGFIATLNLSTTTDEFKNLPIAVTLEGEPDASTTINFTNGAATYIALKDGTYKFTVTYDNEPYEFTQVVSAQTTYPLVMNMWTATIAISAEGSNASRLYNRTITIKKNDVAIGTTSFDNLGVASFKVHETGTYTIECTDADGYVYRDTVPVSAETTYNAALTVYTLNISTTSSDLFGGLITVSKNGTTVGTVYFSSGAGGTATATFYVDSTGTYTASVTYSGDTYEDTQPVSSAQTPTAFTIDTIPDGSTVEPPNDIQIWLACADITDKTYTILSEVLADASTLQALIASNNAADYMARSTDWASSVVTNSNAMTYIGANNYCADKLLVDSTWCNAICDSAYFENVLNVKVPTMTSNTKPSGVVLNSNNDTNAYQSFDGNSSTMTVAQQNSWIQYMFTSAVMVKKVTIKSDHTQQQNVKIQGSNNSTDWTTIQASSTFATKDATIKIYGNITRYKYYRVTKLDSVGTYWYEIQFYGRA